ncbi:MAG: double-strand break repair helicase AddA [Limimaricola sp.]|uniref:double-strand break repair helicase AddA n=1 Tax=Limimaricola sp. TaxID=2211665 RepID=UPI001D937124|nr:double-strand break repair helicase AddA [Limimaricola sp.]MBI1417234.1 double-strand break repair helicase AddA [Limimaricola sp.]
MTDEATLRQIRAADPRKSTWVSANAGSGKTRVLTSRVARLLLDGVDPQNVLCLTYTKAAAREMQNRLFRQLGQWAMRDDGALQAELRALGVERALGPGAPAQARTLFARAVETPGGLKIQTIHAFCASILRRFPLEAGVSPRFTEMEDHEAARLRADVLDRMALGPEARWLDGIARYLGDTQLDGFTRHIAGLRAHFQPASDRASLAAVLGVDPAIDLQDLLTRTILPDDLVRLDRLRVLCGTGSTRDGEAAEKLASALSAPKGTERFLALLESVFLTGGAAKEPFTAKIGSFPTKPTRERDPALIAEIEPLMRRVEEARRARVAIAALDRAEALHGFARAFLPLYEMAKQARGLLDFDDLIARTRALLADPDVADWVLFKLDGGIDHILVDEAQDTSPAQWSVIASIAKAFAEGEGARSERLRTIFVVGDKKQSIYSFQGADPATFDTMQADFAARWEAANLPFQPLALEHSFRSSEAIMRAVDMTFTHERRAGLGDPQPHVAFKTHLSGRVDLWPVVEKSASAKDDRDWDDPVDATADSDAEVVLAQTIADEIQRMIREDWIADEMDGAAVRRRVRPGDVLILVQRRSELFAEIIRACKAAGLDIAGADRLRIGGELAVKDIAALLRFLALPEDDLSLAAALRSPLFGWSEQQLFTLAHHRGKGEFLWAALRRQADDHGTTMAVLEDLRERADFLRPYDLIERLLTRHDGRRRLLARLGREAEDGIDALLAQALAFERAAVPSLTGFVSWIDTEDVEIKRQMDGDADEIRVMTVHGAKGLESPIVILPDTAKPHAGHLPDLLRHGDPVLWRPSGSGAPPEIERRKEAEAQAQAEERRRLLYVAMTRAEKWLIVCGYGDTGTGTDSWHAMVAAGLQEAGAEVQDFPTGPGLRLSYGAWNELPAMTFAGPGGADVPMPVFGPLAPETAAPSALSPSGLGGEKVLPGDTGEGDQDIALARGHAMHLLLEHMVLWPEVERKGRGLALLGASAEAAPVLDEAEGLVNEAVALIGAPDLAEIFVPEALTEVGITADLAELGGQRIEGVIDRLIVRPNGVLAVDYKTNRVVPSRPEDTPEGLLRQMGAYRAALLQIYADRPVDVAILWTSTGQLMQLPHAQIMAALQRASFT